MVIYNMKKEVMLVTTFLFLIFTISFAISQETTETEKIDKAYECLSDKVEGKCSSLTSEEKIFSLLAINECKVEVIEDSANDEECWPASNCKLKTTAQAILALDNSNSNTEKAEDWLFSQNRTASGMEWFLQVESSEATTCSLSYSGSSHSVDIGEDKKISNNAGSCLTLAQDDYWLRISPSCYDEEFEISCDQTFLTTLLFKKTTSSTIQVSEKTSSAAAGGTTMEKVDSFCFSAGSFCDYEGSLWAALVLDSLGGDVSSYLPYLITFADENQRLLPEAFLYFITANTEYRTSLLSKQKNNKWWQESGDRFYDTALALYPFKQDNIQEKTDTKSWLLDVQDSGGCWGNNIRNTAFLLSSIWPRDFSGNGNGNGDGNGVDGLPDCENAGFFCMSRASCEGDILAEFDCLGGLNRCCSVEQTLETCSEINGEICSSNEECTGDEVSAADTNFCCVQGFCETRTDSSPEISECEINNGVCRGYSCNSDEQQAFYSCDFGSDTCCVLKTDKDGKSYAWVWVLLILIVLVIVGIIFRDKLRDFWMKIKSGRRPRPGPFSRPSPGLTPPLRRPVMRHRPQRRILPPQRRPPAQRPRKTGASKELDDVLKKLKEMGK